MKSDGYLYVHRVMVDEKFWPMFEKGSDWMPVHRYVVAKHFGRCLTSFRSGFCQGADFTYVMAPKGVVPLSEVPKGVGLVEVDVERVRVQIEPVIGVVGAVVAKKSTFSMDSRFKTLDAHQKYVTDLIARIAARNTIENMRGVL